MKTNLIHELLSYMEKMKCLFYKLVQKFPLNYVTLNRFRSLLPMAGNYANDECRSWFFFIPQNELDASVVASLDLYTDLQLDTLCGSDPSFAPTDACFLTFDAVSSDGSVNLKNFLLIGEPKDAPLQVADVTVSFWFPNCILFEKKEEWFLMIHVSHAWFFSYSNLQLYL